MKKIKNWKVLIFVLSMTTVLGGCGLKPSNRRYAKALEAYEAKEYETAADLFQEAIEKNPDKTEFYLDYGFTLIQLEEFEHAKEQFQRVISEKEIDMVQGNNKKAYRGLGIVEYCSGQYELALEQFEKALAIKQEEELNTDLLLYQSSALELLGRLEEALTIYEELLKEGIETAGLYRTRGNLYRKQGEYEKSLEDYEKAISMSSKDFSTYLGKFAALKELEREGEASEVLKRAEELPVNSDADLFDLAQVHFYQGNRTSAKIEFEQVLEKGFVQAKYFLGELALEEGDFKTAKTLLEEYISSGRPGTATMYNQLLVCCLQLRDLDAAGEYLEKAKILSDASIRQELARNEVAYLEYMGNFEEALDKMERYLVIYPDDDQAKNDIIFLKTRVKESNDASN